MQSTGTTKLSSEISFNTTNSTKDIILVKYSENGDIADYKILEGYNSDTVNHTAKNLVNTVDNGFIFGMRTQSSFSWKEDEKTTFISGAGSCVIKCNSEGKLEWYDMIKGVNEGDVIYGISQTLDDGYAVAVKYNGNILLSNGDLIVNDTEFANTTLIKYNSEGKIEWHREITSKTKNGYITSVKGLSNGKIAVTIMYNSQITLPDGTEIKVSHTLTDGAIVEFDNKGNVLGCHNQTIGNPLTGIEETQDKGIIVCGVTSQALGKIDSDKIKNQPLGTLRPGGQNGFLIKLHEEQISPEKQGSLEIDIENDKKEYKIQTAVKAVNGVKGGSISGEKLSIFETVKYGESSIQDIIMRPKDGYEIAEVTVNGVHCEFKAKGDGSYTIDKFNDVKDDKYIVVTYVLSSSKVTIKKVDANNPDTKLAGAKLRLDRIPAEDEEGQEDAEYTVEVVTNSEGEAVIELPYGTYSVTELEAPEGYDINKSIDNIVFSKDGDNTFTIKDNKKPSVIVHHYLRDRDGRNTQQEVASDEVHIGEEGEPYRTEPKTNLDKYDIAKKADGDYDLPDEMTGVYEPGEKVITYYYEERKIPLTVHYYKKGTEEKVPLKDEGRVAEDVEMNGYTGDPYNTEPAENVSEKYELEGTPYNANGKYEEEAIVVTYYYELKTVNITTKVIEHEENDEFGQTINVAGGNITGDEVVEYGDNSENDIIITPEKGYRVKSIKINGIEKEDYVVGSDNIVKLERFEHLTANQEIEVEFERIPAKVVVHHYLNGTDNTKVPLTGEGEVEDDIILGYEGNAYTTSKSSKVPKNYRCVTEEPQDHMGEMTEEQIEVTYYYELITPIIEDEIEKTAEANKTGEGNKVILTKEDGAVTYTISYTVTIKDYIGKATVEIVDTLPAKIDEVQSNTAKGQYNEQANTITWTEEIGDIDTFKNGDYVNEITKVITIVYENQDVTQDLVNTVKGSVKTYYPDSYPEKGKEEFEKDEADGSVTVEQEYTVNFKLIKVWNDNQDQKGKRPDSVIIKIEGNGKSIEKELNEGNGWQSEEQGLPKYTEDGEVIEYTVTEREKEEDGLKYYGDAQITNTQEEREGVINYTYTITNPYEPKPSGGVTVHHYVQGTENTKVPLNGEGEVEDELITGKQGDTYTTSKSSKVPANYRCVEEHPQGYEGELTEEAKEVTYYYELITPTIEDSIEKTVQASKTEGKTVILTKENGEVTYRISYNVTIRDYIGKATVEIVDTLPAKIDSEKSKIENGQYDEGTRTITWTEEIEGIDTFASNNAYTKTITKEITIVYKEQDVTKDLVNTVKGSTKTYYPERYPEKGEEELVKEEADGSAIVKQEYTVNLKVVKEWEDNEDQREKRPDSVVIKIEGNGQTIEKELNEENTWQGEEQGLPKYSEDGEEIDYIVTEKEKEVDDLKYYEEAKIQKVERQIEGITNYTYTVTNTYELKMAGDVRVHHYVQGTDNAKVPLNGAEVVEDDVIKGYVGDRYTTSKSSKVPANYRCVEEHPQGYEGELTEEAKEVTYYYELITPTIEDSIEKTVEASTTKEIENQGTVAVLTKEDGEVTYTIRYNVTIKDYIGKATIEIVDTLPAKIDLLKSDIKDGDYNEETNTITWTENIEDIDTFTKGDYINEISKEITIVYEDQDVTRDLENTVKGSTKTYYPDNYPEKETEEFVKEEKVDTAIVKQEYKVNFKLVKEWDDNKDKKGKRPESVTISIKEGENAEAEEVVLNESNKWQYEKTGIEKYNAQGEEIKYIITEKETAKGDLEYYEEAEITETKTSTEDVTNYLCTVTNRYKLMETNFNTEVTKTGTSEITTSNDKVSYTINFKSKVTDYIGEGKVTIVDTLPYKIDKDNSELAEGVYDDEKQTITWTEELEHINTELTEGSHEINITKTIEVKYKDIDLTANSMKNEVKGKVELYESEKKDEATGSFDTDINVKGKVIVKYVDKDTGKEIAEGYEIVDKVGTNYNTEKKDIQWYNYLETKGTENGKIKEDTQEVIYYYTYARTSVSVKYQDENGEELADEVLIEGKVGDSYKTEEKEIENYRLLEVQGNTEGTMTKDPIIVTYVYERISARVIVKYVDKDSGEELLAQRVIEGDVGEEYEVLRRKIEGYVAVEPEPTNSKGNMTEEPIEIIYYYRKAIKDFSVEKIIESIIVNEQTVNITNNKITKIEIKAGEINTAKVLVKYIIKVRNNGDLEGITKVLERIPEGYEVELAPDYWEKREDGNLETTVQLGVGEEKELSITLRWINDEKNLGAKANIAEIIDEEGIDNNIDDNKSQATIVTSIKTGEYVSAIIIGMLAVSLVICGYMMIRGIRGMKGETDIKTIRFLNKK